MQHHIHVNETNLIQWNVIVNNAFIIIFHDRHIDDPYDGNYVAVESDVDNMYEVSCDALEDPIYDDDINLSILISLLIIVCRMMTSSMY